MFSILFRIVFALVSLSVRLALIVGTLLGQLLGLGAMAAWKAWRQDRARRAARRQSAVVTVASAALPKSGTERLARFAPERRFPTAPRPLRTSRRNPGQS